MTSQRPPPAPPADGFFSRWSRRKEAARQAGPEAEPAAAPAPLAPVPQGLPAVDQDAAGLPVDAAAGDSQPDRSEPPKPLSLVDAQALSAQSDFVPFMARGVAPEVRNAAMKKLFADPHYNVMDGLDIYIDDYSKTVPLPVEMIKRLASAKFLGLFEEDPPSASSKEAGEEVTAADASLQTSPHADTDAAPREITQTEASDPAAASAAAQTVPNPPNR